LGDGLPHAVVDLDPVLRVDHRGHHSADAEPIHHRPHLQAEVPSPQAGRLGGEHGEHELLAPVTPGCRQLLQPAVPYALHDPVRVEEHPPDGHDSILSSRILGFG
jgi:hypothetical protein